MCTRLWIVAGYWCWLFTTRTLTVLCIDTVSLNEPSVRKTTLTKSIFWRDSWRRNYRDRYHHVFIFSGVYLYPCNGNYLSSSGLAANNLDSQLPVTLGGKLRSIFTICFLSVMWSYHCYTEYTRTIHRHTRPSIIIFKLQDFSYNYQVFFSFALAEIIKMHGQARKVLFEIWIQS